MIVRHDRRGISLIETIACVAIVGTMATSLVGMMRGSARVAAVAQGIEGVPAEGRKTLRFVSDRIREYNAGSSSIVGVRPDEFQVLNSSGTRRIQFEIRRSSDGLETTLVMIDPAIGETICLENSARSFSMEAITVDGNLVGIQLVIQLQASAERVSQLRPDQRQAEITTTVCLTPQL